MGNVLCGGLKLFAQKTRFKYVLLSILALGIVWLLISNILDNLLFWLLIAPFGILTKLTLDK